MLGKIALYWQWALPVLVIVPLLRLLPLSAAAPTAIPLLLGLHLPIYMVHQIEEHLWPGGFRAFVNQRIFHSKSAALPATAGTIALINIGFVWVPIAVGALPAILWSGFLWIGLAMMMVSLVNGLAHGLLALSLRQRNPGLITALGLLIPFSIWGLYCASNQGLIGGHQWLALMAAAAILHLFIAILLAMPWLRARSAATP